MPLVCRARCYATHPAPCGRRPDAGGGRVQFGLRRVPLLLESGDEHLLEDDPLPFRDNCGPLADVVEDVGDRLHVGDVMVELEHRRPARVDVRVDQPRTDEPAGEVDGLGLRPGEGPDVGVAADGDDAGVTHRQCLHDRVRVIGSEDPPGMQDQFRRVGRRQSRHQQGGHAQSEG